MDLIRGVTIDDVSGLTATMNVIRKFPGRIAVRVVLDPQMSMSYYDWRIRQLYGVADVMIQFGDSSAMTSSRYGRFPSWKRHVDEALNRFLGYAKYWEIANEPNQPESFIGRGNYEKCLYALDACRAQRQITVATYLMGSKDDAAPGCYFLDWIGQNPLHTDLVLASCYPFQLVPSLPQSLPLASAALAAYLTEAANDLSLLEKACPDAKGIGWGETGGETEKKRVPVAICAELCRQFYLARPPIQKFVGGVFYWDFVRDCVKTNDAGIRNAILESIGGVDGKKE